MGSNQSFLRKNIYRLIGLLFLSILTQCEYFDDGSGESVDAEIREDRGVNCVDNTSFRDAQGDACFDWQGLDCTMADEYYGYTDSEQTELISNCHKSCDLCDRASGCEGKCSKSCKCGKGETGCQKDVDCESGLYCKIRDDRKNICRKNHGDNNNNDDDDSGGGNDDNNGGNGNKTVYTTASAPDLDLSDRMDFKKVMVKAGYKDLGDIGKCKLDEFKSLLQRKDIKTLYHASHGSKGTVWLMDGGLECNNAPKFAVENVIFATCLTLTDDCWKNQMGPTSNNVFGYTKVSFDGIANKNAIAFANNISSGQSYIRSWYASNTSLNQLKDRWCAYVREGSKIVEYSARSGNNPKAIEADLQPVHTDEIVFVDSDLLSDSRVFKNAFGQLSNATYKADVGGSPRANFYSDSEHFLKSDTVSNTKNMSNISDTLKKTLPSDAVLEEIKPIESDGIVVAHRIRFKRVRDGLEVRTGGLEHHKEFIVNGDQVVASSAYWPNIAEINQTKMNTNPMMTVQETVLELADELVMIARNSVAILSVQPCYGSESAGDIVPAHCFTDTEDTIWVVNAITGDLVE